MQDFMKSSRIASVMEVPIPLMPSFFLCLSCALSGEVFVVRTSIRTFRTTHCTTNGVDIFLKNEGEKE